MACAPSEDFDQPGHPPSLIRVFAVCSKASLGPKLSSGGQQRLWSDWADAQADLSLRWAHMPFCWFCHEMAQLMYMLSKEPIVAFSTLSNIGRLKTTTHRVIFSLVRFIATFSYSKNPNFLHFPTPNFCFEVLTKKLIEKSRECNNHKPQPTPDTKRKRKMTKLTYTKQTTNAREAHRPAQNYKVAHNRLLYKLSSYGVKGNTLGWISSFLSGRSQKVVLEGKSSSSVPVLSGIPQGSVLGPVLFLIYINDLPEYVSNSTVWPFANDTLLYLTIHISSDHDKLQEDLNNLKRWESDFSSGEMWSYTYDHKEDTYLTLLFFSWPYSFLSPSNQTPWSTYQSRP